MYQLGRNFTPVNLIFSNFLLKVFGNTSDLKIPPCLSKFYSLGSHFYLGLKKGRKFVQIYILFYHDLVPCRLLHANKWKIGRETVVKKGNVPTGGRGRNFTPVNLTFFLYKVFGKCTSDLKIPILIEQIL